MCQFVDFSSSIRLLPGRLVSLGLIVAGIVGLKLASPA